MGLAFALRSNMLPLVVPPAEAAKPDALNNSKLTPKEHIILSAAKGLVILSEAKDL